MSLRRLYHSSQPSRHLNEVDLAIVVDTTASMYPFIGAAREQLTRMLQSLVTAADLQIDLQVGIVEYRDHPPQERTFVTREHPFSSSFSQIQRTINVLTPKGGGDPPEAVFDGLEAACSRLTWRPHARRLAVLVGDAPPHGTGHTIDSFRNGCPCGLTLEQTAAVVEEKNVILYALGLTAGVEASFSRLAELTGGSYFSAGEGEAAISAMRALLVAEFADFAFDAQVLDQCAGQADWTIDALCAALDSPRGRVSASISRLGRRGLLDRVKT